MVVPDVTSNPPVPTEVGHTNATLTGEVSPAGGGDVTECHLEWGTSESYSETPIACSPPASIGSPYSGPTKVMAVLSGLTSQTTYHYRFSAKGTNGTNFGEDQSVTPSAVLAVVTEAATELQPETATLHGSFTGEGNPTHYYFEYGADATYGFKTEEVNDAEPNGHIPVEAALSNLGPGHIYHYRLVAINSFGTTYGGDMTFVAPQAPTIVDLSSRTFRRPPRYSAPRSTLRASTPNITLNTERPLLRVPARLSENFQPGTPPKWSQPSLNACKLESRMSSG